MDTNNEDILAYIVVNGEEHTFIKYEPVDLTKPRVYGTEAQFYIITEDNKCFQYTSGEKTLEGTISSINSLSEIQQYSSYILVDIPEGSNLYQLKIGTSTVGLPMAFSNDNRTYYGVTISSREKKIYIGGEDGNNRYELNESIDPTPYLD